MKKVLILSNSLSGLYCFRKEVIQSICDSGYKVYISVPKEEGQEEFFKSIGCSFIFVAFKRRGMSPLADIQLLWRYRGLIKKIKPSVVLTYTIKPNVYGGIACRLTHVPQLANITGLGDAVENGGWLQKLTISLYRIGLSKAKKVFIQNSTNRSFCIQHHITDNDSVLLPGSGVNLSHHRYQLYPAYDGKIRFLFIGRLLKDKGVEEFFEAAKVIKGKYPFSEFQVLGSVEGPYQSQLDNLVNDGIIKYLGKTTDVRPFIGAVECTVMPSYHEGMSNVNLESAANGRPVITTDVAGCRETIDDGLTGYLVEARSSQSLLEAFERFILLPYSQKVLMGKNARYKVEKEFDRKIVVKAYLKEIESASNV